MISIKPEQKIYLTFGIFIILSLLLFSFLIFPLSRRIKETNKQLIGQRQDFSSFKEEQIKIDDAGKVIKDLETEKINKLLLSKNDILKTIVDLENIARETRNLIEITVKSANTQSPKEEYIELQTSLWGGFPNLIKFLNHLENHPYLIQIQNIEIQRISEQETAGKKSFFEGTSVKSVLNIKIFIE